MSTTDKKANAIIYHAKCWDGLAAAWVVDQWLDEMAYPAAQWIEGVYQQEPDYEELACYETIYIVDFSYPPDVLDTLSMSSKVVLIDHHKSAKEMLADYENPWVTLIWDTEEVPMSGAVLAWNYLFNMIEAPKGIQHISDRDIWAWKLEGTKEFCAALQLYPADQEGIYMVAETPVERMYNEGSIILQVLDQQKEIIKATAGTIKVYQEVIVETGDGDEYSYEPLPSVPFVNCPPWLMSETLNDLAINLPFAVGHYYDAASGKHKYSLRSDKNNPQAEDVSRIAKHYGGGGHKNAAGFEVYKVTSSIVIPFPKEDN